MTPKQPDEREVRAAERLATWLEQSQCRQPVSRGLEGDEPSLVVVAARLAALGEPGRPRTAHREMLWQRLQSERQALAEPTLARREFLARVGAAVAGLLAGGVLGWFVHRDTEAVGDWVVAGSLAGAPLGSVQVRTVGSVPVVLIHAQAGLYALSGLCTHQACRLRPSPGRDALVCPCHGAVFELSGVNRTGPGGYWTELPPLPAIPVRVEGDRILIWHEKGARV